MAVDDERLEAAIERLAEADRFAEAETIVARAAPQLQRVLAAALAEGGWFGESHESESLKAATVPDPEQRIAAVRTLLARGGADRDDGWRRRRLGTESAQPTATPTIIPIRASSAS